VKLLNDIVSNAELSIYDIFENALRNKVLGNVRLGLERLLKSNFLAI
jgi:hypothetical protein